MEEDNNNYIFLLDYGSSVKIKCGNQQVSVFGINMVGEESLTVN